MKKLPLLMLFTLGILLIGNVNAQMTKELEERIQLLERSNLSLMTEVNQLKSEISSLRNDLDSLRQTGGGKVSSSQIYGIMGTKSKDNITNNPNRCRAITSAGNPCSRNADPGSEYCWQHKSTYEPKSTPSNLVTTPKSSTSGSSSSGGRVIHTGPRGGKYYINSKGNKVYVK